jgi:hypothetical protein
MTPPDQRTLTIPLRDHASPLYEERLPSSSRAKNNTKSFGHVWIPRNPSKTDSPLKLCLGLTSNSRFFASLFGSDTPKVEGETREKLMETSYCLLCAFVCFFSFLVQRYRISTTMILQYIIALSLAISGRSSIRQELCPLLFAPKLSRRFARLTDNPFPPTAFAIPIAQDTLNADENSRSLRDYVLARRQLTDDQTQAVGQYAEILSRAVTTTSGECSSQCRTWVSAVRVSRPLL